MEDDVARLRRHAEQDDTEVQELKQSLKEKDSMIKYALKAYSRLNCVPEHVSA